MILQEEEDLLLTCVHQGEGCGSDGVLGESRLLQVSEARPESRGVDSDTYLICCSARDEHVLRCLDDGVALLQGHHGCGIEVVI